MQQDLTVLSKQSLADYWVSSFWFLCCCRVDSSGWRRSRSQQRPCEWAGVLSVGVSSTARRKGHAPQRPPARPPRRSVQPNRCTCRRPITMRCTSMRLDARALPLPGAQAEDTSALRRALERAEVRRPHCTARHCMMNGTQPCGAPCAMQPTPLGHAPGSMRCDAMRRACTARIWQLAGACMALRCALRACCCRPRRHRWACWCRAAGRARWRMRRSWRNSTRSAEERAARQQQQQQHGRTPRPSPRACA